MVPGVSNAIGIATGVDHTCVLLSDSTVLPAERRGLGLDEAGMVVVPPVPPAQLRAQTFRVFAYATSAPLISFGFSLVVESRAVLSS
jgi:hypothetical protein